MTESNLDALCDLLDEDDDEESDVQSMEDQLRQMQKQMALIQEKLEAKKKDKKNEQSESAKASPVLVDLFTAQSGVQSSFKSPVKTNPFIEVKTSGRLVKPHQETFSFGPALPKKVSRTLTGEEKNKILDQLNVKKDSSLSAVRNDLTLSSDEEGGEDGVPGASQYNAYGLEVSSLLKTSRSLSDVDKGSTSRLSSSAPEGPTSKASEFGLRPHGFNKVTGSTLNLSDPSKDTILPTSTFVEKNSRIRISNAIVNQTSIDLGLVGRKFIGLNRLQSAISRKETNSDWATIGVIYNKSSHTSKNGNSYTLLNLTDLVGEIQTCSVYLFGKASAKLYSLPMHRVIGILNAKILDDKNGTSGARGSSESRLSIDHPDKVMELGDSLDVAKCAATKADGSGCTNLVNKASCEYCVYHVKKAYNSISSKRGDLQSSFSGNADIRGRIMSKVDPKGKMFAAGQMMCESRLNVGKASVKHTKKDRTRLEGLGGVVTASVAANSKVHRLLGDQQDSQILNDAAFFQPGSGKLTFKTFFNEAERAAIKKVTSNVSEELGLALLNPTSGSRVLIKHLTQAESNQRSGQTEGNEDPKQKVQQLAKEKQGEAQKLLLEHRKLMAKERAAQSVKNPLKQSPKLGKGFNSAQGFVDLNMSKVKAVQALKGKPIAKEDPNYTMKRKRTAEALERAKKKIALSINHCATPSNMENSVDSKESPRCESKAVPVVRSLTGEIIDAERMAELRNRKSANQNLAEEAEREEQEEHFDKLEKKEAMEEKMLSTREIETTVYTCKICKYTSQSQSELCRSLGHPAKKIKAMKRFFECQVCKRRTTCFDRYPNQACSQCGNSKWVRVAMIRERKGPLLDSEQLLIRGLEQKFVHADVKMSGAHLNL